MTEPVLIAGAGPVGLSVAASLVRQGIAVEVFERGEALSDEARASTLHASTLEYFADWGFADDVVAAGRKVTVLQFWERETRERVADFDYALIASDTAFPFRLQCPQSRVTRIMLAHLERSGLFRMHFGARAVGQRELDGAIELTLETGSGRRAVRGSHLVAADGAASAVRESLGLVLDGVTYQDRFLLVGSQLDYTDIFPGIGLVAYVYDPSEWVIVMHLPDVVRTVFRVHPEEDEVELLRPEAVRARMERFIARPLCERLTASLYRVHQRVARTFRVGRVLLAGDAAHINNPAGGMGMNSGIHDAHLLGTQLGAVLRGADPGLLDQYAEARKRAAVEMVQASSDRNYRELSLRDPAERMRRNREMAAQARDPAAARAYLLRASLLEGRI